MKKLFILSALLTFFSSQNFSQTIFPEPLSERIASYDISVNLNDTTKILKGKEILHWKNVSGDEINELRFHLYLNAFKNTKSTFIKESGLRHRGFTIDEDDSTSWGWIDVNSMKIAGVEDLTNKIVFIQPDDGNKDDQTVIKVPLARSVKPGGTIDVEINFTAKLPEIMARTGFRDDYFLVGQWFPKIGVYEKKGQRGAQEGRWNCHQFHANTEFYADYGVYNVDITLPKKYKVGATGLLQKEVENEDGTKTLSFHAEDVLDFAWTASPHFVLAEGKWHDINIKVLLQPQHYQQADRHINSIKAALEYFDKHLGKFPYPQMTIVDPPFRAFGSAGMEYPMFITAGCLWGIPDGLRLTENVVIHEFGHNYFMGLLATNEFEEAYLDEGFNTYFETRIMDHTYGTKTSMIDLLGYHAGDGEVARSSYVHMKNPKIAEMNRPAWKYTHGGYGSITYQKTATWLRTMQNIIGEETMDAVMMTYYDRWKFKHPSGQDFVDVANEVIKNKLGDKFGENMNWFFDQMLNGTDICDYKVASISNQKMKRDRGIYDTDGKKMLFKNNADSTVTYKSRVVLYRLGEVIVPQDVLIHFDNGEEVLEKWDGKARTFDFTYYKPNKIVWAKVDPYNKIWIDVNVINNGLTTQPETASIWKYAAKVLFWAENVMASFFL